MTKKLILFVFSLLVGFVGYSQGFKSGYIVFNNGKKIFGLVKVSPLKQKPDKLFFKENETAQPQVIFLRQLRAFSYEGKEFFRAYVRVDLSGKKQFTNVKDYKDFFSKDTIFLQKVYEGKKSLYRGFYNDKDLFYIRQGDSIVLLEEPWLMQKDTVFDPALNRLMNRYNYQVKADVEGEAKLVRIETYKFQLSMYLSDYPEINDMINNASYNFYSLYNLFRKYYNETAKKPHYAYILPYEIGDFGFFVGKIWNWTDIQSETDMFYYLSRPNFIPLPSDYFGVYAQNTFWQTNYRLSLYTSLAYRNFHTIGVGYGETNYYDYMYTYTVLNISFLEVKFLMKYNALLSPVRVSFFVGGGYNLPLFEDSPVYEYGIHGQDEEYRHYDALKPVFQGDRYYTQEVSGYIGMSVSKGRLALNITAGRSSGFLSPMRLWQRNTSISATVSYSIFKQK